jgi:hypothetical protein
MGSGARVVNHNITMELYPAAIHVRFPLRGAIRGNAV